MTRRPIPGKLPAGLVQTPKVLLQALKEQRPLRLWAERLFVGKGPEREYEGYGDLNFHGDHEGFKDLPFNGGAIGYFSYDLARRLEKLPSIADDAEQIPEMAVGIYNWAVVVDHQLRQSFLVGQGCDEVHWQSLIELFSKLPLKSHKGTFKVTSAILSNMDKASYTRAFQRVKHYLKEGDCYQVNLSQRFVTSCEGDPWEAYQLLREMNAAPFSAYLNFPEAQILSSSPERFLQA